MVIGSGGAALVGVIIVMAEKRRGDSVSPTNEDLVKINPAFSCLPQNTPETPLETPINPLEINLCKSQLFAAISECSLI